MSKSEEAKSNDDCYQISDEEDLEEDDDATDNKPIGKRTHNDNGQSFIRGPYERAWTTEATRALIHIRGPMEDQFNEGRNLRTPLWVAVTKQLHRLGFRYSPAKVQKKWHNILITYNKNASKNVMMGQVHWEFFDEMHKYLKGKKNERYSNNSDGNACNDSRSASNGYGEEWYQFQQQLIESDEPFICTNNENEINQDNKTHNQNDECNNDAYLTTHEQDDDSKKIKLNNHDESETETFQNSKEFTMEISNVQGGTEIPDELKNISNLSQFQSNIDEKWLHNYFERKLDCEQEKIQLQREIHRDQMNFNKMSLLQQEKIERIKIDAINNLTTTLQKLVEFKKKC